MKVNIKMSISASYIYDSKIEDYFIDLDAKGFPRSHYEQVQVIRYVLDKYIDQFGSTITFTTVNTTIFEVLSEYLFYKQLDRNDIDIYFYKENNVVSKTCFLENNEIEAWPLEWTIKF